MSQLVEIKVPDIGDYKDVPVIEVHVQPGDQIEVDQSLVTLESDKATMDVPAPAAGTVREVKLKVGDSTAEGATILLLEPRATATATKQASIQAVVDSSSGSKVEREDERAATRQYTQYGEESHSEVDKVIRMKRDWNERPVQPATVSANKNTRPVPPESAEAKVASVSTAISTSQISHASPSVRKFARELGVDITQIPGSGPKGRILQGDVQSYVKNLMSQTKQTSSSVAGGSGLNLLPWPKVDFAKFGPIETKPLPRVKKISAANLARNWVMIPAVTYHENADVTELEAFRLSLNKENEKTGIKLTLLAFLIKASAVALKKFPEFNASLEDEQLILKHYFHIGFAADTPNGLLVPVIRDVDQKGVVEIAQETAQLAKSARDGKLKPEQMQGACFTISSVGGIGGTGFAPIINAPEVAILGVSKTAYQPVWDGKQFQPRLIMPLSMTADHRVIDGAMATRFNAFIAQLLGDFRRTML